MFGATFAWTWLRGDDLQDEVNLTCLIVLVMHCKQVSNEIGTDINNMLTFDSGGAAGNDSTTLDG